MDNAPYNAGQTIEIEHVIHGVDLGRISVTENWGRLFIRQGNREVMIEKGAYLALRDAISHFIEPEQLKDRTHD